MQVMTEKTIDKTEGKGKKETLAYTACQELMSYGLWSRKTRVKRWVAKNLLKRKTAPEDLVFWPTGLLAAGLWQYLKESSGQDAAQNAAPVPGNGRKDGDKTMGEQIDFVLASYYERWRRKGFPVAYLDDLLAGETLLSAYEEYLKGGHSCSFIREKNAQVYWEAVELLAAYGLNYPVDEMGSFPYRAAQGTGQVFVDSIGLACPFLYRYGVVGKRTDAMELAVKQIVNFLAYGMDGVTGLPYHGYCMKTTLKYGIIGWGRGVGWLLRGMAGCMGTEYGAGRLGDSFISLVDAALAYQHRDGYFSWQLQAMDGPVDTSATGMICQALRQGMELGVLREARYESALQTGKGAIRKSVRDGHVYDCSGECEGLGQYPQRYGAYPWSLGSALML